MPNEIPITKPHISKRNGVWFSTREPPFALNSPTAYRWCAAHFFMANEFVSELNRR